MKLVFIRHGETEWSLSGQHTGRTNLPLTARATDAARELALWLRNESSTVLIGSSPVSTGSRGTSHYSRMASLGVF